MPLYSPRLEILDEGVSQGFVNKINFTGSGVIASVSGNQAAAAISSGGGANTGIGILDFGSFPGKSDTSLVITGQAGILSSSIVDAWLRPVDSSDHLADEHLIETIKIGVSDIVAGTGFTIRGFNTSGISEPTTPLNNNSRFSFISGTTVDWASIPQGMITDLGGKGTLIYGVWNVEWRWQ